MNYVSLRFWIAFAALLGIYGLLRLLARRPLPGDFDRVFLLAASLILFGLESALSLAIFLSIAALVFASIRLLPRLPRRLWWPAVLATSFVAILPLIFFKYLGFLWPGSREFFSTANILIPIGISFYTFQLLGLLVDEARASAPRISGRDFLNFAAFFPQIVAGPIERRANLLPQLQQFRFRWNDALVTSGCGLVVTGLFYKLVVADNLAASSEWIVKPLDSPWTIHLSNLLFGLRIYFDFCGYGLIAVGLGQMLGIRLTNNFQAPYARTNIRDFWRAWHISLTTWFRDYIYIPLGGKHSRYRIALIVAVFLISGVWHGAGWNFILWGASHGLMAAVFAFLGPRLPLPRPASWLLTFALVMTTWLFFYQTDTAILLDKCARLIALPDYLAFPKAELLRVAGTYADLAYMACSLLAGLLVLGLEALALSRSQLPYRWTDSLAVQCLMVVLIVCLAPVADNGFVYFNF